MTGTNIYVYNVKRNTQLHRNPQLLATKLFFRTQFLHKSGNSKNYNQEMWRNVITSVDMEKKWGTFHWNHGYLKKAVAKHCICLCLLTIIIQSSAFISPGESNISATFPGETILICSFWIVLFSLHMHILCLLQNYSIIYHLRSGKDLNDQQNKILVFSFQLRLCQICDTY